MSLRLQLLGTITLVLLGTLLLAAWLTYRHAINKIETEMVAAIAVGSRIAHNAVDDDEEVVNPRRRLELLVGDFDGDRHLKAFIIENDDSVRVTSKLAMEQREVPAWFDNLLRWKSKPVELKLPDVFNGVGRFALQTDASNEIGETWSDISLFAKILAFFCTAGILVTLYILGRAMKPLRVLTAAFHRIGAADYAPRMSEEGPRELVEVATGFNQMASRLAEMEHANKRLLSHLETVQEEERSELARNLHDEVSPLLFCIDVDAMTIRRNADANGDKAVVDHALAIQRAVDELKVNVKGILGELRPSNLHALNVKDAIGDLVAFWSSRHPATRITAEIPAVSWGAKIDDAILSIVRESVSNAVKHATPEHIAIMAHQDGGAVVITISDDGGGLRRPITEGGYGILGMKERASKLGGTLIVTANRTADGVTVRARFPAVEAAQTASSNFNSLEALAS